MKTLVLVFLYLSREEMMRILESDMDHLSRSEQLIETIIVLPLKRALRPLPHTTTHLGRSRGVIGGDWLLAAVAGVVQQLPRAGLACQQLPASCCQLVRGCEERLRGEAVARRGLPPGGEGGRQRGKEARCRGRMDWARHHSQIRGTRR